jgi:ribosomal protein S18 acetylase RimI-like enzyme
MSSLDVVRHRGERLRAGPWRGDPRVAYLAPVSETPPPSPDLVRHCVGLLAEQGYREAITGALTPREQRGFLAAGFAVREHLHLLAHDLLDLPTAPPVRLRRGRRRDRTTVLTVDARSFEPFWRLDRAGLQEAMAATPSSRFRVSVGAGGRIVGYAVSGRAGHRGYVQRLAVDPDSQGRGVGTALLVDGLQWMRRRGVQRAAVNTQVGNAAALALYERLGFRPQPGGLAVLHLALGGDPR